jgi:modulator of FtsH protease HflC
MKLKSMIYGIGLTFLGLVGTCNTTYNVTETEQAVITRMGKPIKMVIGSLSAGETDSTRYHQIKEWNDAQGQKVKISTKKGLHLKVPLIDKVNKVDDRILEYDAAPTDVVTKDKKHLIIDNYARWHIQNPLLFMKSVYTENGAQSRLDDVIYSSLREETGQNNLVEILRSTNDTIETTEKTEFEPIKKGREKILEQITYASGEKTEDFGIGIVDVRIKRADLPKENAKHVFDRMTAERQRIAKKYRSEGEEEAMKIRAETNRDTTKILAEAYKTAEELKGQGDGQALKIYADAYSKDPKFFKLFRTYDAYGKAFGERTDKVRAVMPLGSDFNKYLLGPNQ